MSFSVMANSSFNLPSFQRRVYWEMPASANHFPKADTTRKQTGLLWKIWPWAFGAFEQRERKKIKIKNTIASAFP